MKVRVSLSAEQNLTSGFHFYEKQAEKPGAYPLESLYADIEAVRFHAGIHRQAFGYHRCQAKRFPFAVYYFILDEAVSIRAVFDLRREPSWIRRKLHELS